MFKLSINNNLLNIIVNYRPEVPYDACANSLEEVVIFGICKENVEDVFIEIINTR